MITQPEILLRFGVAIGIGFLVGLQREYAHGKGGILPIVAGERTFAILSLMGALAAMISDFLQSPLIFFGIMMLIGLLAAVSYYAEALHEKKIGITTEAAMFTVVLAGGLCYWGELGLAVAVGIAITTLLSLKLETDRIVRALTSEDINAALQLAVISAIILPVLPNMVLFVEPFDVLVPFRIWLMVVFISSISFVGYILLKFLGTQQAIGVTGFLGGMISSTAVTMSFSERSKTTKGLAKPLAFAILIAWTSMFPRILIEVGVVNADVLPDVWIPITAAGAVGLAYSIYLYLAQRHKEKGDVKFDNPFRLISAIRFGLIYAVVLLVARIAQVYFNDAAVLISALLSGLADVNAITLSLSEFAGNGSITEKLAAQGIVLAAMANTATKGAIVIFTGSRKLRKALLPGMILVLLTGIVTAFFF